MRKKNYKVMLHKVAIKELSRLPKPIKDKACSIIDELAFNPVPQIASKLHGRSNAYRIRMNDYRIVYEVHVTEIVVYIVGVAHRKDVYRHVLRRL